MRHSSRAAQALMLLLLTASCGLGDRNESPAPPNGELSEIKPGFNLLTPEQDVEIGKASVAEVEKQLPFVEDEMARDFVSELGAKLAANAPGPSFSYSFRIVDASDLNAFALPGGPIFINRGVLQSAKTEGEVAGVLAHEIAHVALRHGTHNVSKAYLTRAGIGILGGILGRDMSSGSAAIINILGGVGLNALFLKHSRAAETQADVMGARILAQSGYDPREMIGFFRTLQETDKRKTIGWLSDHPTPDRRIERLEAEAAALGAAPVRTTAQSGELAKVQARLRGMPAAQTFEQIASVRTPAAAPGAREDVTLSHVPLPSGEMFRFKGGSFVIDYPANWEIHHDTGQGVTFAPRGGLAPLSDGVEIMYGAMVNHYQPFSPGAEAKSGEAEVSLLAATRDLVQHLKGSSLHLQVVGERPTSGDEHDHDHARLFSEYECRRRSAAPDDEAGRWPSHVSDLRHASEGCGRLHRDIRSHGAFATACGDPLRRREDLRLAERILCNLPG